VNRETVEQELPTKGPKAQLLVVDDEPAILNLHARLLAEYAPLRADEGIAAREILTDIPVDVVVCDLGLPGLGGLDLMRWAKVHRPRTLWIVVSAQDTFDAAAQALRLGAFDFICKPFLPIQLQTAVANAIRHQALLDERAKLVHGLSENNVRLAESLRSLEVAYRVLRDQRSMMDEDLRRAERIMRALLPQALPKLDTISLHVGYRPSHLIGGDLYGAEKLDDRYLAVYVADAAGHGVSAALLAVLFKQRIRLTEPGRGPRSPAAVLEDLNRDLSAECRVSGLFLTVVVVLIDTVERSMTIASAGHPPSLHLRHAGVDRIEPGGPALGLCANAKYAEQRLSLASGDRLFLYTDGLSGCLPQGQPGFEAVVGALGDSKTEGSRAIDNLFALTERTGSCEDDVTLLLVAAERGASSIDAQREPRPATPSEGKLSAASVGDVTWIVVQGHAIWKHAPALRHTCVRALEAGRGIVIDLSACTMLDSTVLGTLHEVVGWSDANRPFVIQNVGPEVRQCFVELSMTSVLSRIAGDSRLPEELKALDESADAPGPLVLRAHELLSELSPHNAEEFAGLIEALRRENS
jgi:serine phosphatase RsbU (regulator of sigma subunit)/anti-anti-sigma regulatory factor